MFFQLAQLSKFFIIAPITWIVAALVVFFCVKRKWLKYSFLGLAILLFLFFTNPYILDYTKYRQTQKFITDSMKPDKVYDVAIVMGGFSAVNPETGAIIFPNDRADRLLEAVRLYKKGKVRRILITGDGATEIHDDGSSDAEAFLRYMEDLGVPREAFILEQRAKNTRQNAVNSMEIIREMNLQEENILLITSALHMERSLDAFTKEGLRPDYHAVGIERKPTFSHLSLYPSWKAAQEWQEILNEVVGSFAYKAVGFI